MKCSHCQQEYLESQLELIHTGEKLCRECKDVWLKESYDYKILLEDIEKKFGPSNLNGYVLKRIKDYRKLGYKCEEIRYCIDFTFRVKNEAITPFWINTLENYLPRSTEIFKCRKKNTNVDTRNLTKINKIKVDRNSKKSKGIIDFLSFKDTTKEE